MRVSYRRVSTDQKHQATSLERQEATFIALGCDLHLEERESGTNADRPVYQQLIKMIKLGEVSEVIASRSDRLNRNQHEMRYFYNLCIELGVAWKFTDEPELSSSSPWGVELRSQKAYEAQLESERIARRQERYYVYAEDSGKAIARNKTLGYRITKARKYEIDFALPDGSNVIGYLGEKIYASGELARALIDLFLQQQTLRQALKIWKLDILGRLNTTSYGESEVARLLRFAPHSMREWLGNPVLRGHTAYGKFQKTLYGEKLDKKRYVAAKPYEWRIKWNTHPDQILLSEAEWRSIERVLEANKTQGLAIAKARINSDIPVSLSTILRCRHCGLRFVCVSTKQKGKFYRYYYCCGRKEFHCQQKGISEKVLVQEIIQAIVDKAQQIVALLQSSKAGTITIDNAQLSVLQAESIEADRKYRITGMKEFLTLHQQLKMRAEQIEANRSKEVAQAEKNFRLLVGLASPEYWASLPPIDLHRYLRGLVKDCWIQDARVVGIDLFV